MMMKGGNMTQSIQSCKLQENYQIRMGREGKTTEGSAAIKFKNLGRIYSVEFGRYVCNIDC